jgi:hypothetical protein
LGIENVAPESGDLAMRRRLPALAAVTALALTAVAAPASAAAPGAPAQPDTTIACAVYDLTTKLGFDYAGNPYDC